MKFTCIKAMLFSVFILITPTLQARDHLIYSIDQDIPMGYENEIVKKNYYVNMGNSQGVSKGTTLNVYRIISKMNPYDNQRRVNYKVQIGTLKVIHSDDEAAIALLKKVHNTEEDPFFEINNFMVGDSVSVNVE